MTSKLCILILIVALLLTSTALLGERRHGVNSADSSSVKRFAFILLTQLYDGNANAGDFITWQKFSFNGFFAGDDYLDAVKHNNEDTYKKGMLAAINKELHTSSAKDDTFENWRTAYGEEFITVTADNAEKTVSMVFMPTKSHSIYLHGISITDRSPDTPVNPTSPGPAY